MTVAEPRWHSLYHPGPSRRELPQIKIDRPLDWHVLLSKEWLFVADQSRTAPGGKPGVRAYGSLGGSSVN